MFHFVDSDNYAKYTDCYSVSKCWGVRGIYAFVNGAGLGLCGVVKELVQGTVVQYNKRRLATGVITGTSYVCSPAVAVIINSSKVR